MLIGLRGGLSLRLMLRNSYRFFFVNIPVQAYLPFDVILGDLRFLCLRTMKTIAFNQSSDNQISNSETGFYVSTLRFYVKLHLTRKLH